MGMNSRMSARSQNKREAAVAKMYKDDKNFRADKLKTIATSFIKKIGLSDEKN